MMALVVLDALLLTLALLAAGDALRQVQALHYPAHAIALVLIVVVSFAGLVDTLHALRVHAWPLLQHVVLAVAGLLGLLYPPEARRWDRS